MRKKTLPLVDHNFRYCTAVSSCCAAAAEIFYRTASRGRRMKTGLQDKVSSPRSPASSDNEFAASLAAQLAAQAEKFHKASPISPASADDDFGKSLGAKLAARSERLRTGAFSTPPPSSRSDFSAPGIDPGEERDHSSSLLASIRVGHLWLGLLLVLFAAAAVLAVRGLPFPPSEPLPPSPVEQAKPAIPRADDMPEKAPPPASVPAISPPPASPSPATSLEQPPAPSAPHVLNTLGIQLQPKRSSRPG